MIRSVQSLRTGHKASPLALSLGVTLSSAVLVAIYEVAKQLVMPEITILQSQEMTIIFVTALSAISSYYVIGRLQRSEERYQRLFENSRDAIYVSTPEGKLVDFNDAFLSLFGYARREIFGLNARELYAEPVVDRARFQQKVEREGFVKDFEVKLRRKDGALRDCLLTSIAWRNERGEILGYEGIIRDVTEREQMRQEVLRSRRFLEGIVENANVWLMVLDQAGNVLTWNKAAEQMSGYAREEVVGHSKVWEWLYPDEQYRKQASVADGENVERWITRKDGQIRIISWNSRALRDEKNCILGSVTLGRDVTDQVRMQKDLESYSKHLKELVEERTKQLSSVRERLDYMIKSNPAAIYSGEPLEDLSDWHLTYISRRVVSMLGFEPREFIGHPEFWTSHVHPEDLHPTLTAVQRLWKEGQHTFEYRFLHKDGTYRWIREEAQVVRDRAGKPVEVMGYWTDVTERKRMKEEVRASKERLEYVVASNPAVIFTGKPFSDYTDFDFTYVSSNTTSMLGYDARDFIDDPRFWSKHVHPDDTRRVAAEIPRVFMEDHLDLEYRFRHKDGTYRWIREQNRLIRDKERRPQEVIGYWTDVTEWKRMEAELVKSQRLVTIGQTTAMVGHDLRNPLQAIDGSLYVLRKQFENTRERQRNQAEQTETLQMLDMIEDSVAYMNKIVSDLQNYAAPLRPELATFSIDKLLNEALSTIRIPPTVKVSVNVEEGFRSLTVDPALMKRVFTNLATNAVQAMPHGGELIITAQQSGENALISFSDTGAGIAEEDLARLFEPFFTTKPSGQGLGLSVCKRLVEAHGGNVTVDSTLRKGSTFTVRLPLSKSQTD
jgi:PAS domain S-box-containing protein